MTARDRQRKWAIRLRWRWLRKYLAYRAVVAVPRDAILDDIAADLVRRCAS